MRSALVALTAVAALTLAQGSSDLPRRFASRSAAARAGCRFAPVKGPLTKTCVLATDQADPMRVVVYERSSDGSFTATTEMAIPSWSWTAKLSLVDVLGRGTDWLVIVTAGNHGTALSQRILLLIAWDGARFQTVAVETLEYGCFRPTPRTADYRLTVEHAFVTADSTRDLNLKYAVARDNRRIAVWSDTLRWDDALFRFVPSASTIDVSSPMLAEIRGRIANVREYSAKRPFDPVSDSWRWMAESGLVDVLAPACSGT